MSSLFFSITAWGERKNNVERGGVYHISFKDEKLLGFVEYPSLDGATRVLGGMAIDREKERIFVARDISANNSQIELLEVNSFRKLGVLYDETLCDIHQLEYFQDMLWAVNTNKNQVAVYDGKTLNNIGIWDPFPDFPEELLLSDRDETIEFGDKRKRLHFNSIHITNEALYVGHFGVAHGAFNSSQLTKVSWNINSGGKVNFGEHDHIQLNGLYYPHNAFPWRNSFFVCNSAMGEVNIGEHTVKTGEWPRGVALYKGKIFVGLSSCDSRYSFTNNKAKVSAEKNFRTPIIVIIDENNGTITGYVNIQQILGEKFNGMGQIYDVRIMV